MSRRSVAKQPLSAEVGVLFNPALADFVADTPETLDYLAVIPDRFWIDKGTGVPSRFEETASGEAVLARAALSVPIVLHGIGLSICSAGMFDTEYLRPVGTLA